MLRYFIEQFTVLFFALAASGLVIHILTRFYTVMVLQLLLAFVVLLGGIVIQMHAPGMNNQWLFNTYIIAETALLLYAGALVFDSLKARVILSVAFALFLSVWLFQVAGSGISLFAQKAYIIECIMIVGLYFLVLYRHITRTDQPVYTSPVFWISCSLILSFGCSLPYFGFLHFFQQKSARLNTALYQRIVVVLQNVRYLFIGIAFLLYRRHHANPQTDHESR